jgi:selenophosphate synthase
MDEKRAADRWEPPRESHGTVVCNGFREEVKILDVSNSGMRVFFTKPFGVGSEVYAKVTIGESEPPYYVLGEINRIVQSGDIWEASIQFNKVKQEPIRKDIEL